MLNLGVYFARSLKQQSMGRYVAPMEHIILILSQAVFTLTFLCCVLSGEAAARPNFESLWFYPNLARIHHISQLGLIFEVVVVIA
jgi:hypothetical protein